MKRLLLVASIIGVIIGFIGCKCSSDVLATYDGVEITRGQFKEWLEDKQFSVEAILKSKKQQKDKLEMMAIEHIALQEAKKENLIETEKYKFLEDMAYESILLKHLYNKKIKDVVEFNEPAYHVKQILIRVRDFKIVNNKRVNLSTSELEKAYSEAENKAKEIIDKIKSGQKFEELAKMYSDDFSKKNGGDIGYVVKDMLAPEVASAIESSKSGIIENPIKTQQGIYIIQLMDKQEITKKNLNKIIKDEMQAKRLEQILLRRASNNYIEKLMSASDVQFNEKNCKSRNPKDVIFKVGDSSFTVADLEKRISYFQPKGSSLSKATIDDTKKIDIAKNAFKVALLKREAIKENLQTNEELQKEFQKRKNMLFAKEYMDYIGERGIAVTPKEIRDEYEKYKDTRFTTFVNQKGKQVKQILPFEKVKDQIESMLYRKKRSENLAKWKRDMLHINKFTIHEDELEGK
ncbi:MAG: peptidylprolyl isomerase [Spirochaetota bacterium]|nr:peptidylprolyl isomerase [Spirochaetota bacterium]